MGYIKQQIKVLIKEAGDKKKARMISEEWFREGLKDRKQKDVTPTAKPFKPGKIYVFDYVHPIGEKELDWFDRKPVVLALSPINETTDCGVNLNLLPVKFKEDFLDAFYKAFESTIDVSTKQKPDDAFYQRPLMNMRYDHIKKYMDKFGYGFAVRRYNVKRKRNQTVVSYESWPRIVLCDFTKIFGSTVWAVRRLFAEYYINRKKL